MRLSPTTPLYALYTRRLRTRLARGPLPSHVALIMDGNRRWARQAGLASASLGHQRGAEHALRVLGWCEALGVRHVTVFVCSTENLARRDDAEVAFLMNLIERAVTDELSGPGARWQVHIAGTLDVLPDSTARVLKNAVETTRACATGNHVTLAIGYGGRQEVVDALRDLLHESAADGLTPAELADRLTPDDIARHLYTAGHPDPDLIIRTGGTSHAFRAVGEGSSACRTFCSGRAPIPSCISARRTGPRSARSTSCARCAGTRRVSGGPGEWRTG